MSLVARQHIHETVIPISPYESLGPGNAYSMNFIYPQSVYIACYQGFRIGFRI